MLTLLMIAICWGLEHQKVYLIITQSLTLAPAALEGQVLICDMIKLDQSFVGNIDFKI